MPKSQSDFLMKRLDALSNQRSKNKKSLNVVKRHSKSVLVENISEPSVPLRHQLWADGLSTTQNSSSSLKAISSAVFPTPAFT